MSIEKESISVSKFFTGLIQAKTGLKALAFLPWIILFLVVGYTFWRAYFKKQPPATTQNAEQITNYNYTLRQTFGCSRFPVKVDKQ